MKPTGTTSPNQPQSSGSCWLLLLAILLLLLWTVRVNAQEYTVQMAGGMGQLSKLRPTDKPRLAGAEFRLGYVTERKVSVAINLAAFTVLSGKGVADIRAGYLMEARSGLYVHPQLGYSYSHTSDNETELNNFGWLYNIEAGYRRFFVEYTNRPGRDRWLFLGIKFPVQ